MKKMITILSMVMISSAAFATSDDCVRRLNSLMYRQYEISRFETSAMNRISKGDHKGFDQLQREADRLKLEIEERKETFLSDCIVK